MKLVNDTPVQLDGHGLWRIYIQNVTATSVTLQEMPRTAGATFNIIDNETFVAPDTRIAYFPRSYLKYVAVGGDADVFIEKVAG